MVITRVRTKAPQRCAYCHADVGRAHRCTGCGTALHAECARELGRCPLGCGPGRFLVPESRLLEVGRVAEEILDVVLTMAVSLAVYSVVVMLACIVTILVAALF